MRRRQRHMQPVDLGRRFLVAVTSPDGLEHLVSEGVFASATDGHFMARCGAVVISASLSTKPSKSCALCAGSLPPPVLR